MQLISGADRRRDISEQESVIFMNIYLCQYLQVGLNDFTRALI